MTTGQTFFMGSRYYRAVVTGINTLETTQPFPPYASVNPVGTTLAPVFEVVSPYAAVDLDDLHYVQSADVMTLTHLKYQPYELRRTNATTPVWAFTAIVGGAGVLAPTPLTLSVNAAAGGGIVTRKLYKATAVGSAGEGPASTPFFIGGVTTLGNSVSVTAVTTGGSTAVEFGVAGNTMDVATSGGDDAVGQFTVLPGGVTGLALSTTYTVRRVTATSFQLLNYDTGAVVPTGGAYTAGGSFQFYGAYLDLNIAAAAVDVFFLSTAGATSYNVYKSEHGGVYGYIGNVVPGGTAVSFRDNNITPDISTQPPNVMPYPFTEIGRAHV